MKHDLNGHPDRESLIFQRDRALDTHLFLVKKQADAITWKERSQWKHAIKISSNHLKELDNLITKIK